MTNDNVIIILYSRIKDINKRSELSKAVRDVIVQSVLEYLKGPMQESSKFI